jgi:hypothetical protein
LDQSLGGESPDRKSRWRILFTSLCVTIVLLLTVEVLGNVFLSFFPWIPVGNFHYWRNPIANMVVFLPLLPAFIGSAVVEPTFQPARVIGATIGSLISPYFTDSLFISLGLRGKDFYLILVAEHGPETFFNYFLAGVVGGIIGWIVKSLWRQRVITRGALTPVAHT